MYKQLLLWASIISGSYAASSEFDEPLKRQSTTVTKAIEHLTGYVEKYKEVRKSVKYIPVLWVLDARGIEKSQETKELILALGKAFQPEEAKIHLASWSANPFQNERSIESQTIFWDRIIRASNIHQMHQSLKDAHINPSVKFHLILTDESFKLSEDLKTSLSHFGIMLIKKKSQIKRSFKENNDGLSATPMGTVLAFSNTASPEKSPEKRDSLKPLF